MASPGGSARIEDVPAPIHDGHDAQREPRALEPGEQFRQHPSDLPEPEKHDVEPLSPRHASTADPRELERGVDPPLRLGRAVALDDDGDVELG
jgi:hypothetical protein